MQLFLIRWFSSFCDVCFQTGLLNLFFAFGSGSGSRFGHFAWWSGFLFYVFDDTDSNCLTHITDSESTEWWIVREFFHAHWFWWDHFNHSSFTWFQEFWCFFNGFTRSTIDFFEKFRKLASNVSCVTIEDWSIASTDLTRMIENNDLTQHEHWQSRKEVKAKEYYLSNEASGFLSWIVLDIWCNETTSKFFHTDVFDVEANVVAWYGFYKYSRLSLTQISDRENKTMHTFESFVVHFDRFDFSL